MSQARTLFEKLDASCEGISLKESICQQVQRIISTRSYSGEPNLSRQRDGAYIDRFGVPEIVDQYSGSGDELAHYRQVIREQIMTLEPRLLDVEVIELNGQSGMATCQLLLTTKNESNVEQFYFQN